MADPQTPTRDQIMADLAASDAEIDAGDTVPAETVEAMIEAAIARTEQRVVERRVRKTAPGE